MTTTGGEPELEDLGIYGPEGEYLSSGRYTCGPGGPGSPSYRPKSGITGRSTIWGITGGPGRCDGPASPKETTGGTTPPSLSICGSGIPIPGPGMPTPGPGMPIPGPGMPML